MRILLTVHQFLPDHLAGTEILTYHTAKELQRRGHHVEVLAGHPAPGPLQDSERFESHEFDGLPVRRFLHHRAPMGAQTNTVELEYNNRLVAEYVRAYLRAHPQDLVHFFHLARLSAATIDACVDAGIPTVFTATDFWCVCPTAQLCLSDGTLCQGPSPMATNCVKHLVELSQPEPVARRLRLLPAPLVAAGVLGIKEGLVPEQWFSPLIRAVAARPDFMRQRFNAVDRILVPTQLMKDLLRRNGIKPSSITQLPYGIDLSHIRRDVDKGNSPALRIGFIGRLADYKGAHLLVQAVRSLPVDVAVNLTLYGDLSEFPPYAEGLRRLSGDDPRIDFAGTFPNPEIGKVFAGLDVLVVPSIWYENAPLVIYSAFAAGCPVIATALGGMSEIVMHGRNGLLFERGSVAQLAGHLALLASDRPLLKKLAASTSTPKSIAAYVDELEVVYSEILRGRSRARTTTDALPA